MLVKFRIPEIFLGVFLAIAVFEIGFQFASSPARQVETDQTGRKDSGENAKGQSGEAFWQRTFRDPVAFFTLWVAGFTAVLGFATIGLLRATSRSAEISERALVGLERPYVFIVNLNWAPVDPENPLADPTLVYTVSNGGRVPAVIKRVSLGIRIGGTEPGPLRDAVAIHELLTGPLVQPNEPRTVAERFSTESWGDVHDIQIRGGQTARIPAAVILGQMFVKLAIEYDGPITRGHETVAAWEWHAGKHAFSQFGGEGHNKRT